MHTSAPVDHGGVAGVDVDADTVSRPGVSGAADGVQPLERTGEPRSGEGARPVSREASEISQLTHGDKVHLFFGGFGDGERQPSQLRESREKNADLSRPTSLNEPLGSILEAVAW